MTTLQKTYDDAMKLWRRLRDKLTEKEAKVLPFLQAVRNARDARERAISAADAKLRAAQDTYEKARKDLGMPRLHREVNAARVAKYELARRLEKEPQKRAG